MVLPELAPPLFSVPFGNKCRGSRVLGFTRAAVASSRRVFATPNLQYGVILYVPKNLFNARSGRCRIHARHGGKQRAGRSKSLCRQLH